MISDSAHQPEWTQDDPPDTEDQPERTQMTDASEDLTQGRQPTDASSDPTLGREADHDPVEGRTQGSEGGERHYDDRVEETICRVGLVGIGLMGSAMAHRLLGEGFPVLAWDRDPDHVRDLGSRGADIASSAAEVVSGADVVITMLPTAEIVRSVVEPLLAQWPETTIWLQMSSVGASESDQLARVAADNGVILFDAPVSGSTQPAEEGKLTILASGPDSARTRIEPVLDALGSRVQWVGEAGMGSRLKLAANHWMITMVAGLAETMHLCELMGLDQQLFIALLDGSPLGSTYGLAKLGEMAGHEYPAGFPVRLAVKDLELVREVASSAHVDMPVLDAVFERVSEACRSHGDDDLAAVYELSLDGDASERRSPHAGTPDSPRAA